MVWHTQPGFELSHWRNADGENVSMCNDLYSAVIVKRTGEAQYRLIQIDEPYDVATNNRRMFDGFSYTVENEYIPDLVESERVNVSAFEVEGETRKV
jgi:hypothetical protein